MIAGAYTMTATNPPDFHLVGCGGSSSPNGAGTSATESVSVPSGGAGEGLFYAASDVSPNVNSTQTIAGHIYLCDSGSRTTSEVSGGTIGAGGAGLTTVSPTANPSAPTDVIAGTYTVTATNPSGYQLVTCGGSSSPNGAGTSATESVSVPSGGAGVGVFYVTPSIAVQPDHEDGRQHLVAGLGHAGHPPFPRDHHRQYDSEPVRGDRSLGGTVQQLVLRHVDGALVLGVHAEPGHRAQEVGQRRLLLGPGHARHLLLQGDQHGQRHAWTRSW